MDARMLTAGRPVALARPTGAGAAKAVRAKPAPLALSARTPPSTATRAIAPPSTEFDESPVKMAIGDGVAVGEFGGVRGAGARGRDKY
jgi:hypothetical protein